MAGTAAVNDLPGTVFVSPGSSAKLIAMGGSGVSLAEDGSGLYINPAGLAATRRSSLYADYFNILDGSGTAGGSVSLVLRGSRAAIGAGYFRKALPESSSETMFSLGAGWMMLEGAQGSFLSAGAAIRTGILSHDIYDACSVCPAGRESDSAVNGDIGVMLRPLPVISFAYSTGGIRAKEFEADGQLLEWKKISRWGISWFWEETLTISWQRDRIDGRSSDRYGFALRASSYLGILGGFSDEKVSGGFSVDIDRIKMVTAFTPLGDGNIEAWFSIGFSLGSQAEEIQ
jgi:hypothetical protein